MKTAPELSETLAKSASEAKERFRSAAGLIDEEFARLKVSMGESESVSEQVKVVVGRIGDAADTLKREVAATAEGLSKDMAGTADEVRGFVSTVGPQVMASATRVARGVGVPVPDGWLHDDDEATDVSDVDVSDVDVSDVDVSDVDVSDVDVSDVDVSDGAVEATEDTVVDMAEGDGNDESVAGIVDEVSADQDATRTKDATKTK